MPMTRRGPRSCSPTRAWPAASRWTCTRTSCPACPRARRSPRRSPGTGTPGSVGYYNIANRDWIGTYAILEKQAHGKSKPTDTVNDPEIDAMIAQVMNQTDKEKIGGLMRNIFTRLRSEHYGVPVVYLHSPYATSKSLGKWNPGTVMYDFFLDDLAAGK